MDNPLETITDSNGKPITVGTRVDCGVDEFSVDLFSTGTVTKVISGDVDYSDEAQRAVYYPPKVEVLFDDGETDAFSARWDNEGEGYGYAMNHICEDLEVIDEA